MNWDSALARWVEDAQRILREHGFPETWPEIQKHKKEASRLVTCAVRVVAGADYVRRYAKEEKTGRALDKFTDICCAVEEMGVIENTATQDISDVSGVPVTALENKPVIARLTYKDLRTGIKISRGGEKGRKSRKPQAVDTKLIMEIDAEYARSPRLGITDIRKNIGVKSGLTGRTIGSRTKHYNPCKK